jgi:restriction endonuclease Mrr
MTEKWPTSTALTEAVLIVLSRLGGSASVGELDQAVIEDIKLSPALLEVKRSGNRGEIQYRLAWVRTKAKQNGLVTKEANRNWKITDKGQALLNRF